MTRYINWLKLPVNYSLGYPQKITTTIGGFGFDIIWRVCYEPTFLDDEDSEYIVHLKIVNQYDRSVVFDGRVCEGAFYVAKNPFYGRAWFYMKVFGLVLHDMDVRAVPAEWVRNGKWIVEVDD